jgi:hypothetical protein
VINTFKKIEIEKKGVNEFMGLTEFLSIQYLKNILTLTLSLSPKGGGRVRRTFDGCHGKEMLALSRQPSPDVL